MVYDHHWENSFYFLEIKIYSGETLLFTEFKMGKVAHRNFEEKDTIIFFLFIRDCISWISTLKPSFLFWKELQQVEIEEFPLKIET